MTFDNYIIRTPVKDDAEALFEMVNRNKERLIDYFPISVGSMSDKNSTEEYISEKINQVETREAYTFIIMDKSVSKPIGMLFIKSLDWRIPKAELAYYIDKEYEGKGIISKALNNVIEFAFSVLKLNKLYLRVAPDNKGSRKVAEKNSFKIEGTLRNDFKTYEGALIDLLYYGLINNKNSTL